MSPPEIPCSFCGAPAAPASAVRGQQATMCRRCVGQGLVALLDARSQPHLELPEADVACALCGQRSPSSALYQANGAAACVSCLDRGFTFLARAGELTYRRRAFADVGQTTPAQLLSGHLASVDPADVVTEARTFPVYQRVDLDQTLQALLGDRCVGVHDRYGNQTLTFASLLDAHEGQASIIPLRYDDVDIGEDEPMRCLGSGLWLVDGPTPYAVLLSEAQSYGRRSGWHVEVAARVGEAGAEVARGLFDAVTEAVRRSAAYRGKVLSLDIEPHMGGLAADITVHRLAPVPREAVVLPEATLALLERNVFAFVAQREALRAMGLPVKKGLLFYGPPGTGKTHTIRYLTGALPGHTTLLITAEQVKLLPEYMTLARLLSPAIVVIEDADLIAQDRERLNTFEEVLLNKLLNEMDGLRDQAEVLFVLTTNRPETLEAALRSRPGRIDQAIEFPLPDEAGRTTLARLYGRGANVPDATLAHVVERTDRVSAAFIKELMRRSAQFALERAVPAVITPADVDAAIDELLVAGGALNAVLLGAARGT